VSIVSTYAEGLPFPAARASSTPTSAGLDGLLTWMDTSPLRVSRIESSSPLQRFLL
jgi:hypothetical protein